VFLSLFLIRSINLRFYPFAQLHTKKERKKEGKKQDEKFNKEICKQQDKQRKKKSET